MRTGDSLCVELLPFLLVFRVELLLPFSLPLLLICLLLKLLVLAVGFAFPLVNPCSRVSPSISTAGVSEIFWVNLMLGSFEECVSSETFSDVFEDRVFESSVRLLGTGDLVNYRESG